MGKDPRPISEAQGMVVNVNNDAVAVATRESRLDKACAVYARRGSIVEFVETLRDLNAKEKAEFYHDAFIRAKGVPPKTNPFGKA